MIKLKIDVKKIAKEHLFHGAKGTYLDLALFDNKDGKGDYGDDGFIAQEVTKEKREAGVKGPIIGNWRHVATRGDSQPNQNSNRNPMGGVDRTAREALGKRDNSAVEPDDDDGTIPFARKPTPFQP